MPCCSPTLAIVKLPACMARPSVATARTTFARRICATLENTGLHHAQHWLFFFSGALSVSTRPLAGAVTGAVLGSLRAIS